MAAEDLVPSVEIGESIGPTQVIITMKCDEDSVRKGRFITITAGENWPPLCHEADAGDKIGGVAMKAGDTNDYIPVLIFGPIKMYAGAAVVVGENVKSDAEGRAIKIAATNVYMAGGRAMMSAGEADDEFIVFVDPAHQTAVIA